MGSFYVKSLSTSAVQENAVTLFCCDAPEMFCGLASLLLLSDLIG